jgi:phage-related baseplate assembly protein
MVVSWLTGEQADELQVAGVQASANANVDASDGSITLALVQGARAIFLWFQALAAQALGKARLATSKGVDVDSWIADFGQTRLGAVSATTSVLLAPQTPGAAALVPIGNYFSTGPGGTQFIVTLNTANSSYSDTAGGYVLVAGGTSITVPVQCAVAGSVGNVAAGAINSFVTPIPFLDTVTNPVAVTNGVPAETDAAVKTRMALFFPGLRSATTEAIEFAAASVQQAVKYHLRSAYPMVGEYTLYVDDGSYAPPSSFITAITSAVQAVTAEGVQPIVLEAPLVAVSIEASLEVAPGANRQAAAAAASAAVAAFVAGLPISDGEGAGTLSYLSLPGVIIASSPSITGLSSLSVNGAQADVVPPEGSEIQATTISVA